MRIFRIIISIILLFSITFTIFLGFKKIGEGAKSKENKQKEVIVGWQIDGFEGGVGSRRNFLMSVSREYEKINPNYLFMINQYSISEANERLKKGVSPDFISFSSGVDVFNQKKFSTKYYSIGGQIGENTYAVPWCRGGYVLIFLKDELKKSNIDKLIISSKEYNLPYLAFLEEGLTATEYIGYEPKNAYQNFLLKGGVFLGTQRDIVRLDNLGKEYNFRALTRFNDLYQYISITSDDEGKISAINGFVNLLLSEKIQNKLTQIKMFSCVVDLEYDSPALNEMQKIQDFGTISVFTPRHDYLQINEQLRAIKGDNSDEYLKIKNLIVYP